MAQLWLQAQCIRDTIANSAARIAAAGNESQSKLAGNETGEAIHVATVDSFQVRSGESQLLCIV